MSDKLELFERLYQLNDDYHNKKEQMIWLGTTVFLGFTIASAKWIVDSKAILLPYRLYIATFLSIVALLAFVFVYLQNRYKCQSADVTGKMNALIGRFDKEKTLSFAAIEQASKSPRYSLFQSIKTQFKLGKPGLVCMLIIAIFAAADMIFLFKIDP